MPTFPFELEPPPPKNEDDLDSFAAVEAQIDRELPPRLEPILPCEKPYIEISLVDLTQLTPERGARYKLRLDDGREVEGTLTKDGTARIDDATVDLEGRSLRVTYFADAAPGYSYLIELVPGPGADEPLEEPRDLLVLGAMPWLPFGEAPPEDRDDDLDDA